MKSPGGGKALLIEKPTVNGQVSPFPVAINMMGSWKRIAISMGAPSVDAVAAELGSLIKARPPTSFKETIQLLGTALDLRHAKPKFVKDGPCKEVIHKFDATLPRVEPWPKAPQIVEPLNRLTVQPAYDSTVQRFNDLTIQRLNDSTVAWPTLLHMPIQKCWPLDGGRFITLPCVV